MSNQIGLCSFGANVKVCEFNSTTCTELAKYEGNYSKRKLSQKRRVAWSGDREWLIAPPDDTGNLALLKHNFVNKSNNIEVMRTFNDVSSCSFLKNTNKYLVIGSKLGAVRLYDIKSKTAVKTLCEQSKDPAVLIEVNDDDNFVATCGGYSECPTVKLYGLTTSKLKENLKLDTPAEFSDLKFSTVKKNLLACSTLEGEITMWDVYKTAVVMSRKDAHIGSCTGIALSRVNQSVVVSVSLGGAFLYHDVRSKKTVYETNTKTRLMCVDLSESNEHLAVLGAADGRLLFYDVRNSETCIFETQAHDASVESVHVYANRRVSKKFEDLLVNTPEEPLPAPTPAHEISVADICTPPSAGFFVEGTFQKSLAAKALRSAEVESPLLLGLATHRKPLSASTPNNVDDAASDSPSKLDQSSFLAALRSPGGFSPMANSPFTKALSLKTTVSSNLNDIKEEPEGSLTPQSMLLRSRSLSNGHAENIQPVPMANMPCEHDLRSVFRQVLSEQMSELRQSMNDQFQSINNQFRSVNDQLSSVRADIENLKEELRQTRVDTVKELNRNRDCIIYTHQSVGDVVSAIKFENIYATYDFDPAFFREN